jgi:type II pantothenate kinase
MLLLSEAGDNAAVDMFVGDIYGSDYSKIGLKSSTIASTFGKVFRKGANPEERRKRFRQADIAKSLLYAISNNIGHVACVWAPDSDLACEMKYSVTMLTTNQVYERGEVRARPGVLRRLLH